MIVLNVQVANRGKVPKKPGAYNRNQDPQGARTHDWPAQPAT